MLTAEQNRLWQLYQAAESRELRAEKLRALNAFVDALETSTPDWFPWARGLAEEVVDHRLDFVIRRPLFERAVFPALLAGFEARLPGCARWLAGLAQHLYRCQNCRERLPPQEATEIGLLRAAVQHDLGDERSRLRLIERITVWFRNSLHELPWGVLYGLDGATPDQCLEMDAELDEFGALVESAGLGARYAELIAECRRHFRGYREFLLHADEYGSYAEYLAQHP